MRARKTFDIKDLVVRTNKFMVESTCTPDERNAIHIFVAGILHDTGNYHGYNFVNWVMGGFQDWLHAGRPASTEKYLGDQSRVFFLHPDVNLAQFNSNTDFDFHNPKAIQHLTDVVDS